MLKYALIGCGRISPNHFASACKMKDLLEFAAVAEPVPGRAEEKLAQFGLETSCKIYRDYRELLREEKPDLVAICTESGKHAEIGLACLEAGAHVLIEKPIALSLEDADRLIQTAKQKGLKLCACHQNRFNKSIRKIREAREAGRFGRMLYGCAHIRWNRNENYYRQAPWRGTWAQDGGTLMNQCIHNIDLLRWMMDDEITEVKAFTARQNHDYIEAEDLGLAIVQFKNGSYGLIEGTTNIYPQNLEETLYLFGEKGTVKAGGKSVNVIEEWRFADGLDEAEEVKAKFCETPPNVYGFGHQPLYEDWIAAIREDREPYVSGEDGRRALELVLAVYEAARRGETVTLPLPASTASTDNEGRFA